MSSYGSTYQPTALPTSEVAVYAKKKPSNLIGFFRILIVIAEIGLSLIPGIGIGSQAVIGLAAASANTALSVSAGNLTGIGVAIDFGAAVIPGIGALRQARRIGRFTKSAATGEEVSAAISANYGSQALKASRTYNRSRSAIEAEPFTELQKSLRLSRAKSAAGKVEYKKSISFAKRLTTGQLNAEEQALIEINGIEGVESLISGQEQIGIGLSQDAKEIESGALSRFGKGYSARQKLIDILKKYNTTLERVQNEANELEKTFEAIKNLPLSKRISESVFLREVEKLSPKNQKEFFVNIYKTNSKGNRAAASFRNLKNSSKNQINKVVSKLSDEGKETFDLLIRASNYTNKTKAETDLLLEGILGELSDADKRVVLQYMSTEDLHTAFGSFAKEAENSVGRKWVKKLGTKEFNDKFVQRAQLIDPNDIGRYPVELAYQKLKEKIEKKIETGFFKKAFKGASKTLRATNKAERTFENGGGSLISSRYIWGIKRLDGAMPVRLPYKIRKSIPVLVKFNKENTASRKGNNVGGKKDIIVTMTQKDYDRLILEGSSYWFAKGRKRGWFVSRGGKRVSTSASTISNKLSLFLGFVPIPALRNVLSIVSNWVENIADFTRSGKQNYFSTFIPKLERAFVRSSINRTARLTTRVVIGGLASKTASKRAMSKVQRDLFNSADEYERELRRVASRSRTASAWIGRELQRTSTTVLGSIEGSTTDGYFKFNTKNAGSKILSRTWKAAAPTAVKGSLTRKSTRVAGANGTPAFGRQLIGSKRNLGQIGRIQGALTPSGVGIKSLRQLTKIG